MFFDVRLIRVNRRKSAAGILRWFVLRSSTPSLQSEGNGLKAALRTPPRIRAIRPPQVKTPPKHERFYTL